MKYLIRVILIGILMLCACLGGCGGGGESSATGNSTTGLGTDTEPGTSLDPGTGTDPFPGTDPWASPEPVTPAVSAPILQQTLPASWDENWLGSAAVFDLDGDGSPEIIAGRHGVLYVWKSTGALLWRAPVGESATSPNDHGSFRQYAAPVVGDLDGDGKGEIAVAYGDKAAVYRHNGQLMAGWPKAFPGTDGELRSLAADDLDHDGKLEILAVKTGNSPVTMVWRISGDAFPGWPQVQGYAKAYDYGGYNQSIGSADLDGDGNPEIVSTYDICYIGIMYANGSPVAANPMFAGPYASSVPMFHNIDLAKQGWGADGSDRDEFTDSPPVFGDLDGDGKPEIILYSDHERAGEDVNRGNSLWALKADMTRVKGFEIPIVSGAPLFTGYQDNIVQVAPVPALGRLLGDGRPEIVVPSYDGFMRCYSPEGMLLWSYRFDSAGDPFIGASGAAIGDLNNDGVSEVVFTTYSISQGVSNLIILDNSGKTLHAIPIQGRGSMSPPTLADVDGDGKIEIVISLKDTMGGGLGGVQIWNVSSALKNVLPWPTGRGNLLRNGRGN